MKQNILTVIGCISTTLGYVMFSTLFIAVLLHLDVFINSLVIGLMFRWNAGVYACLCRPCIMLCPYSAERKTEKNEKALGSASTSDQKKRSGTNVDFHTSLDIQQPSKLLVPDVSASPEPSHAGSVELPSLVSIMSSEGSR